MYVISGFVRTEDGDTNLTTLEMLLIDPESGDTLKYSIPIDPSGAFSLELKQGTYALLITGEGYEDLIKPLSITAGSNKMGITLNQALLLELVEHEPLVFEGEESGIKLKETEYTGIVGLPLLIPVKVDKGSTLFMKVYHDSVLISTDTIHVDKRRLELEIIPLLGTNIIELEMTDSDGNIHRNRLIVNGIEPAAPLGEEKIEELPEAVPETNDTIVEVDTIVPIIPEAIPEVPTVITDDSKKGGFPVILGVGLGAILLWFILLFIRRRRRNE